MKNIYVIGHRNPDTDSIVSAIAYAELKKALGYDNVVPARSGKVNPQTEYVLGRFGIQHPEFISDLIPKVKHHMTVEPVTLPRNTPLWHAMQILNRNQFRMLPVVDDEGRYISCLHDNTFVENMMERIDPRRNSIISTSLGHLIETLNGQAIVEYNRNEIFKVQVLVAASDVSTLREFVDIMPAENSIVFTGDREDIQAYCIEKGVKALILTGGKTISRELKDLAKEKKVSVISTPYQTSSASWLSLYSVPVEFVGDKKLEPVNSEDYVKSVRDHIADSPSRALPVVDDSMKVTGVFSQVDLMKKPDVGVILVDHNELSQAVDGVKDVQILEIIDHHRLGNPPTSYPITFINRPVGSTSTIIANLYRDSMVPVRKEIASLLLAGILSDTLVLRSATTTPLDRDTADYLSKITDLDIDEYGREIAAAASVISSKPVDEIVNMDMKSYDELSFSFTVSQVEVNTTNEIMERSVEISQYLDNLRESKGLLFSSLLVTDLNSFNSYFFVSGSEDFVKKINYPKHGDGIFLLKDVLSRKKQLMPYLSDILKKL